MTDESGQPPQPGGEKRQLPAAATASGLDESQLAAEDLAAMHAAFIPQTLELGATSQLHSLEAELAGGRWCKPSFHHVPLGLPQVSALKLAIAPLPRQARLKRLLTAPPRLRISPKLDAALQQAVLRRALPPAEFTDEFSARLNAALAAHLGAEAKQFQVEAVFGEIPPEAKVAIRIDPQLRWAAFTWPAGLPIRAAQAGYYLIVLSAAGDQTRRLLLRL